MKKSFCILLAILLACMNFTAFAEVPSLSEKMFYYAKGALTCLAGGDYEKVVATLPFSGVSPSAKEWNNLATGSFTSLSSSHPQNEYAVAYWTGNAWKIAVPVSEPSSGNVEALVLLSEDGQSFTGYGCAAWGNITKEYQSCKYVIWNSEYNASTSAIVEY